MSRHAGLHFLNERRFSCCDGCYTFLIDTASTVDQLLELGTDAKRREYFEAHPEVCSRKVAKGLCNRAAELARIDASGALLAIEVLRALSEASADEITLAYAERADGNFHYVIDRDFRGSLRLLDSALARFSAGKDELEEAITRSCLINPLSDLGEEDRVDDHVLKARMTFEKRGDSLRLARLQHNYGVILVRADRWNEATKVLESAYRDFMITGGAYDLALCLSNLAVCRTQQGHLAQAQRFFEKVRTILDEVGLSDFEGRLDYNIGCVRYLLGDYRGALKLYRRGRQWATERGDRYHMALCDLDEAELLLELSLVHQSGFLAARAEEVFRDLNLSYEHAKSLAVLGLGACSMGKSKEALRLFESAHGEFLKGENKKWCTLLLLYRAEALFQNGSFESSRTAAEELLGQTPGGGATRIRGQILLAKAELELSRPKAAGRIAESVVREVAFLDRSLLEFQAYEIFGQALEADGRDEEALRAYRLCERSLDRLGGHLPPLGLRSSFLVGKTEVYEALFSLSLRAGRNEEAFLFMEKAKSRALVELIAWSSDHSRECSKDSKDLRGQIRHLRSELRQLQKQVFQNEVSDRGSEEALRQLRLDCRNKEYQLGDTLRHLETAEFRGLADIPAIPTVGEVQGLLPADTQLVEYFFAKGRIHCLLVDEASIRMLALGTTWSARKACRLLFCYLSTPSFDQASQEALHSHLDDLYSILIRPIEKHLHKKRLLMVPHAFLHQVPFHALFGRGSYLIDRFRISYAPSASLYCMSRRRASIVGSDSLILGVPDSSAPRIRAEVETVARTLPNPRIFLGEEAKISALEKHGPSAFLIHVAAHSYHHSENPLFSSIDLADDGLDVLDLYQQRWTAELAVLSGCGTGYPRVSGGDNIVGLTRGVLSAGARSAIVSLWNVDDEATCEFMKELYRFLLGGKTKDEAIALAIVGVRANRPHPYYWAPFVLIGDPRPIPKQGSAEAPCPLRERGLGTELEC